MSDAPTLGAEALIECATPAELRSVLGTHREAGARIGFVPTMGFLHEGHLRLVDEARRRSDVVVLSIFVNPLQFGPGEDLARYPRDLARDRALAMGRGVAVLFVPDAAAMYPVGSEVRVVPGPMAERWEGEARPGHFIGVLTVVAKLFNVVAPDVACFGQKDIQQAALVRRMVHDLDWPIEIAIVPTRREPDGLAMSSRNVYLSEAERRQALGLSAALRVAHQAFRAGETRAERVEEAMRACFATFAGLQPEYIAVVDPDSFQPVARLDAETVVAVAGRVGATRLIDNIALGPGL